MPCDPIRNPVRDDQKIAQGQDASIGFTLKASATLGKTASKHFFQRRGSNPFGWLPAPLKHHIENPTTVGTVTHSVILTDFLNRFGPGCSGDAAHTTFLV